MTNNEKSFITSVMGPVERKQTLSMLSFPVPVD